MQRETITHILLLKRSKTFFNTMQLYFLHVTQLYTCRYEKKMQGFKSSDEMIFFLRRFWFLLFQMKETTLILKLPMRIEELKFFNGKETRNQVHTMMFKATLHKFKLVSNTSKKI